ncbi:madd-4 [Pristionchus pacificus]|nr:madd-4 [Pristionchus pacificus]
MHLSSPPSLLPSSSAIPPPQPRPSLSVFHSRMLMKGLFLLLSSILCLRNLVESVYVDEEDGFGLEESPSSHPRLVHGEWSECSVSCGNGVQSRTIECRVSHPLAGHLKLPLDECRNVVAPPLFRPCSIQNCALKEEESRVQREDFHWKHSEWSPCSVSCLGGKQRALLQCIQLSSGRPVAWSNCDGRRRPPEKTRSCNSKPCPPEWEVSSWSSCSTECGSTRSRAVSCISTATRAGGAIARVKMNETECRGERPASVQSCPSTECAGWKVEDWSQCSVSCGRGEERRVVTCAAPHCPLPQPEAVRPCERDSCPQEDEEEKHEGTGKKLTLDLGGVATIYQGTNIKVKCPRKKEDVRKMYWLKDGEKLSNNGHIKVSSNGNLRIGNSRMEDAGLYECFTPSGLRGNVTIRFKLREKQEKLKGGKAMKKGRAKFKTGEWGECHQSNCQLRGIQERKLECFVSEGKSHRNVSVSICDTLNVTRPLISRPCSRIDCAKWNATHWSPCNSSPCVRKWTSEQTRKVECLASNGRKLDPSQCEYSSKPAVTTLCANPSCIPEWRTNDWNACSSTCGTGGVQLRLLYCVWSGTGEPAGKSCDGLQQPRTTRACSRTIPLPACAPRMKEEETPNCEDLSRFCDIIKLFHSCESEHVRQRCCSTCTKMERNRF